MRFRERVLEDGRVRVRARPRVSARRSRGTVSRDEEALQATGTDGTAATRLRTLDEDVRGVVRRGPQDPVFIISPQSEKTMALEYGCKAFGGLVGGPPLTLFGVWCLHRAGEVRQLFR